MGLFKRSQARQPVALTATAYDLVRLGRASYGGDSPYSPGPQSVPPGELDGYVLSALETAGFPATGSEQWTAFEDRFLNELVAEADAGDDWAVVGAFCVAVNFAGSSQGLGSTYLELMDRALEILRADGVAYTVLPPFAVKYWEEAHGTDGARPAGWPSALENVAVPAPGTEPQVTELASDESRRLAENDLAVGVRTYFAERRPDGQIVAVIEGVTPEDNQLKRWDWDGLAADNYPGFLRGLGDRLVTPTRWAHPDLAPYFPCRPRSRADMRRLAAT